MAINTGTLAQETDGKVEYIYPKTTASLVECADGQSIEDKINDIDTEITKVNNRISTINDFISGNEIPDAGDIPTDNSNIVIDDALSDVSTHPVQNKVITKELKDKVNKE